LTALSFRIPVQVKQSLTTMQIIQFIIGCALAGSYLFISYSIPVAVRHPVGIGPYASMNSDVINIADGISAGDAGVGPLLKKLALRAAGAEGVAENVGNPEGKIVAVDGQDAYYRVESRTFNCLDTTGQAFATLLNVLYLFPLTYLFARFFVRSYLRRKESGAKHPGHARAAEKAGMDAFKGVTRELKNAVFEMHGNGSVTRGTSGGTTPHPEAYEANVDDIMTPKQLRAEKKTAEIASHPSGVALAVSSKEGIRTPLDERAYEANIGDVMTEKQKQVDEDTARISDEPAVVKFAITRSADSSNPLDERSYEANVKDVIEKQKRAEDELKPKKRGQKGPSLPGKDHEACPDDNSDSSQKAEEAKT
jgi:hypothetical protein